MEICTTPLAQQNYNILMAGIDQDNQIHTEGEEYRQELQAQQN